MKTFNFLMLTLFTFTTVACSSANMRVSKSEDLVSARNHWGPWAGIERPSR